RYLSCFCFQSIFDLEKLTYCGEGNRTIVVSNTASGWILRIRKSDETATSSHDGSSSNCLSTLAQFPVAPYILRYFGSRFTRKMHLLQTNPTFLRRLEEKIAPHRPGQFVPTFYAPPASLRQRVYDLKSTSSFRTQIDFQTSLSKGSS
ncbi:hypothetical protein AHF37_09701, partial [Paragonimus kellicotti]